MTMTNAQVYVLVGEELGLISGNEALSADDTDKITRRNTSVRAWLIEEGLCYWLDSTFPDAAGLPYAQVLAGQCATVFGRGENSSFPYTKGAAGFAALERHCSQRSKREPVESEYF